MTVQYAFTCSLFFLRAFNYHSRRIHFWEFVLFIKFAKRFYEGQGHVAALGPLLPLFCAMLVGAQHLNPEVGANGVQRVHATKLNRGATPAVLIQNPVVPYFDPYNHDYSHSNAVADCQAGVSYSGGWTALHAAAHATEAGPHGKTRPVKV